MDRPASWPATEEGSGALGDSRPTFSVTREMSLDRDEFMRLLPVAAEGKFWRSGLHVWLALDERSRLRLRLEPLPSLRIGPSLVLPRTRVVYEFFGADVDNAQRFLARFDNFYQRGGG